MRLQEWNVEKIVRILGKLLMLLQKKTGEQYHLIGMPRPYRNAWGKFVGYWVVSSRLKVFRFNLRLEKADQAEFISIDRWKNGILDKKPVATLSLQGFGISKVFYAVIDFMRANTTADLLQQEGEEESEETRLREMKWTPQPTTKANGKSDLTALTANFLGENPSWIPKISSGSFDQKLLAKTLIAYYAANGVHTAGYGMRQPMGALQKATAMFDDLGGQSAAANIPSTKAYKGQPEVSIPVAPKPQLSAEAQEINDMMIDHQGPEQVYALFENDVRLMLNNRTPWAGVIAYGPGGTGKTFHALKAAREEGLSEGLGFVINGGKVDASEGLLKDLYLSREVPLVIFDDCDNVFESPGMENIMKHALDASDPYVQIKTDKLRDENGEKIEPGKYAIESKFIFNTNKRLEEIGKSDAITSRCTKRNFEFSNDEMKQLLAARFFDLAEKIDNTENLKKADCSFILNVLQALIDGNNLQHLNFRVLERCIFFYALAKLQKGNLKRAVVLAVRS
jgi:hypothetical protein